MRLRGDGGVRCSSFLLLLFIAAGAATAANGGAAFACGSESTCIAARGLVDEPDPDPEAVEALPATKPAFKTLTPAGVNGLALVLLIGKGELCWLLAMASVRPAPAVEVLPFRLALLPLLLPIILLPIIPSPIIPPPLLALLCPLSSPLALPLNATACTSAATGGSAST